MRNAPTNPPMMPSMPASGEITGATNLAINTSAATKIPGQSRRDFLADE
jgi:hypothetical protein